MAALNEGIDELRRGPGFLFWLGWVAATVIGSALPIALVGTIGLLLSFATLGIAQGLVLLPYFKLRGSLEWLVATIVGNLGTVVLVFVRQTVWFIPFVAALYPIVGAIVVAYPQWFVLRERVAHAGQWILVNVGAALLSALLSPLFAVLPLLDRNIAGALVWGGLTGFVLERLMRNPGSKAEWNLGIKSEPRVPGKYKEDAQASPEELLERMRREGPPKPRP